MHILDVLRGSGHTCRMAWNRKPSKAPPGSVSAEARKARRLMQQSTPQSAAYFGECLAYLHGILKDYECCEGTRMRAARELGKLTLDHLSKYAPEEVSSEEQEEYYNLSPSELVAKLRAAADEVERSELQN